MGTKWYNLAYARTVFSEGFVRVPAFWFISRQIKISGKFDARNPDPPRLFPGAKH